MISNQSQNRKFARRRMTGESGKAELAMRNLLRWGRGKTQASTFGAAVQPDSVKPGKSNSEPEAFAAIDDLDLRRKVLWL